MCGIVGYIGKRQALPLLLEGLKSLEYRGYDSAGIALLDEKHIITAKKIGEVQELVHCCENSTLPQSTIGIGHTRWATHGIPNEQNAHPHLNCSSDIAVAHNGIIENFRELKKSLEDRGHVFNSATDTEVIPHLIEEELKTHPDFLNAFRSALKQIKGTYAIAAVHIGNPQTLFAARFSSPLVVGIGQDEYILASDPSALIGKTKKVVYINDGEVVQMTPSDIQITTIDGKNVDINPVSLEGTVDQVRRGDFSHFMIKEIFEIPDAILSASRGRFFEENSSINLPELNDLIQKHGEVKRIIILACGTSYYAGLIGELFLEEHSGIPTEVHTASEFRYRTEPFEKGTFAIAISQSGETADTLAALRKAKEHSIPTIGIVNSVGSTIARETDACIYNYAGPEISVASTKAFVSQLTILLLVAFSLSPKTPLAFAEFKKLPDLIKQVLDQAETIKNIAQRYLSYDHFLYIGRKYGYPTALEGALKLKEISCLHAEGCGAGEMKHGPIAMICETFPTMALVMKNDIRDKNYSNIEEIKARKGPVIAIATEGDDMISTLADDCIFLPNVPETLEPFLAIIPLQLFAYYLGTGRGLNVDKPRNLAKSVTVE